MMSDRKLRALTYGWAILSYALLGFAAFSACSSSDRHAVAPLVEPAAEAGCITLRALTSDNSAADICATVEDLAPLFRRALEMSAAETGRSSPPAVLVVDAPHAGRTKRARNVGGPIDRRGPDASADAATDAR
jgi:hypothetical protein